MLTRQTVFSIGCIFLLAVPGSSSDTNFERETLKDVAQFSVLVEDLPGAATESGLTKAQLQTDVELRLRKAGIKVVSRDESVLPYLYLKISALTVTEADIVVFDVEVGFEQLVALPRIPGIDGLYTGQTWSTGTTGIIRQASLLPKTIRDEVADVTDEFAHAYLSVNPNSKRVARLVLPRIYVQQVSRVTALPAEEQHTGNASPLESVESGLD